MTPPRCKCGMYSLGDSEMTWTTPDGVLHSFGSCRVPAPDPAAGLEVIDYYAWNCDDRRYHNTRKRDVIHELAMCENVLREVADVLYGSRARRDEFARAIASAMVAHLNQLEQPVNCRCAEPPASGSRTPWASTQVGRP